MSVTTQTVAAEEADIRLDRWFKRHYPGLSHGRLEKLLRTGQVRVDGKRAKSNQRLESGQAIRVPPLGDEAATAPVPGDRPAAKPKISTADEEMIRACVLHRDASVLVINKPPGLATQGGTGMTRHVDALLDALRFDAAERPRLVHRLDKDTSGVLVLGRTAKAAAALAKAFKTRDARKIYWALVVGLPSPRDGVIKAPISKLEGPGGEKMLVDPYEGKNAVTDYSVIESAQKKVAWVQLEPRTGRTHQLRVHCAYIGTPILGDGKYGGPDAHLQGMGISRKLHLHARAISVPHPDGGTLCVTAPLAEHMAESFAFFGFEPAEAPDPLGDGDGCAVCIS
ncbi:RluA family pseudouridine synthase [Novispirillum sp. DQ9]|uniref:RluA family pseudouridine synthase n=1 Tax=Novispirillum sp. DQ9 TaxID=3398612 RepID=UPI003C7D9003